MIAGHDFYASLRPESDRYAHWQAVFSNPSRVPVASFVPERVRLPIGVREVLFIACDLLSTQERERLAHNLAERFHDDVYEIAAAIQLDPRHAVPILAEDVFVTVLHPQKWLMS